MFRSILISKGLRASCQKDYTKENKEQFQRKAPGNVGEYRCSIGKMVNVTTEGGEGHVARQWPHMLCAFMANLSSTSATNNKSMRKKHLGVDADAEIDDNTIRIISIFLTPKPKMFQLRNRDLKNELSSASKNIVSRYPHGSTDLENKYRLYGQMRAKPVLYDADTFATLSPPCLYMGIVKRSWFTKLLALKKMKRKNQAMFDPGDIGFYDKLICLLFVLRSATIGDQALLAFYLPTKLLVK
ncbi:hypothetical protein Tco_0647795 [Tanacetum coccineum]